MAKYLIRTTNQYRVDGEQEAKDFIEQEKAKKDGGRVVKYTSEYKTLKAKGEVVDDWYRVVIVKEWDEEKEPLHPISE